MIILCWNSQTVSPRLIDTIIQVPLLNSTWRGTFFYGDPRRHNRQAIWDSIRVLAQGVCHPWIMGGDFNEITSITEKQGGHTQITRSMNMFNQLIEDCGLIDLGYHGQPYTWCNKRWRGNLIKERLDRFFYSTD
uniref:Endonuclease/exonuclease/phosphatase domain-containing protein n=1 Tax=Nelumbo nucifera TaxID=4432 RepID=A0A822XXG8_NELNU|nr:TPA_asm: hypothetical protein HUJ06_024928 [Nelumbo nucifera]